MQGTHAIQLIKHNFIWESIWIINICDSGVEKKGAHITFNFLLKHKGYSNRKAFS